MHGMRQRIERIAVRTEGRGAGTTAHGELVDVTARVASAVSASGLTEGLVTVFVRHTSASVIVQENADPAVLRDLERFFARLVRDGDPIFEHVDEGADDMPAHVRAALTATQVAIPFSGGKLLLGTWQAIYLFEHRHAAHRREIVLHMLGE